MRTNPLFSHKKQIGGPYVLLLVSSNDKLVAEIEKVFQAESQFALFTMNETSQLSKNKFRVGTIPSVILVDFDGRKNDTSNLLAEYRKMVPYASVVAMSEKASMDHVQKSFLFGVTGYLTGKDRIEKLPSRLQVFLKTGHPPVSKDVVPCLIHIVRGRTESALDFTLLSELQKNVARALASGMSYQEIADTMHINLDNLRYHIKQVYKKLNITKRIHLVSMI